MECAFVGWRRAFHALAGAATSDVAAAARRWSGGNGVRVYRPATRHSTPWRAQLLPDVAAAARRWSGGEWSARLLAGDVAFHALAGAATSDVAACVSTWNAGRTTFFCPKPTAWRRQLLLGCVCVRQHVGRRVNDTACPQTPPPCGDSYFWMWQMLLRSGRGGCAVLIQFLLRSLALFNPYCCRVDFSGSPGSELTFLQPTRVRGSCRGL